MHAIGIDFGTGNSILAEWVGAGAAVFDRIGVNGSIGAGGVSVDSSINVGVAQGYSITAGKDVIFAGGIPPIPDDPETPEDEFKVHGYSFRPHVYRQHYTNSAGEDAAYYVMHYSVGQ